MTAVRPLRVNAGDVPPNRRRGGDIRVTLSPATVGATSGFGGVLKMLPGESVTEHYHPYSEEFLHVVAGQLDFFVDGALTRLGPGDSLIVPIGARHRAVNTGDVEIHAIFHLSPLAPLPALGHVDVEPPLYGHAPLPQVGGA
ncbi:cupin domain-containing protein [Phytohabitans aurantiacus]|jgi:putative monooxygenase|uniref:16.7 kDa protein in whiE Pa4123 n=1 Tax=Phytohabitans aurantiacus TaxID=3016789 RepID=A0ABQ5QX57_9ACTN|nr:cupin domain-containing protein [Phytohabitans aurantiacus]GLH98502.1 16.7 kDa protein in whiE Pa4123 [Phytohabitans aurantiacus]